MRPFSISAALDPGTRNNAVQLIQVDTFEAVGHLLTPFFQLLGHAAFCGTRTFLVSKLASLLPPELPPDWTCQTWCMRTIRMHSTSEVDSAIGASLRDIGQDEKLCWDNRATLELFLQAVLHAISDYWSRWASTALALVDAPDAPDTIPPTPALITGPTTTIVATPYDQVVATVVKAGSADAASTATATATVATAEATNDGIMRVLNYPADNDNGDEPVDHLRSVSYPASLFQSVLQAGGALVRAAPVALADEVTPPQTSSMYPI